MSVQSFVTFPREKFPESGAVIEYTVSGNYLELSNCIHILSSTVHFKFCTYVRYKTTAQVEFCPFFTWISPQKSHLFFGINFTPFLSWISPLYELNFNFTPFLVDSYPLLVEFYQLLFGASHTFSFLISHSFHIESCPSFI